MFEGNHDGNTIQKNEFEVPIIAQFLRINPMRWRDKISMRVEVYGCDYGELHSCGNKILFIFKFVKNQFSQKTNNIGSQSTNIYTYRVTYTQNISRIHFAVEA